jgi:uncharacterized protein
LILIDANIFMYAAGKESPQREPCQRFLEDLVTGRGPSACTNAEVLQEILHRYRTLKVPEIGFRMVDAILHLGIPVLGITDRSMAEACRLLAEYPGLSTRDGVHLGVMREQGIETILSYDRGFSAVSWVRRLEP